VTDSKKSVVHLLRGLFSDIKKLVVWWSDHVSGFFGEEKPMAAKSVTVNVTSHPLSREENGVIFVVEDGRARFGELVVSKGGVRWKPRNGRDHHFLSWKDLDEIAPNYPQK
jgi:hypothetical protein